MMQNFRKLSNNLLFKIFLGFLALSFVMFGVSNFVLGGFGEWVAEVDGQKISYSQFQKAEEDAKQAIYQNGGANNDEATKYIESEQFKSDVIGRMINKIIIEKLKNDLGINASRELILATIAEDPNLKGVDGKFSSELFKQSLARSGVSEEQYINNIQNEITAMMIIQSFSLVAPVDQTIVADLAQFYQEKRVADLVTISLKNIPEIKDPSDEELKKFFEKRAADFSIPANREANYLHFSRGDLLKNITLTDAEIADEYSKNKDQFLKPETRNFYNVIFDQKEKAEEFLAALKKETAGEQSKLSENFEILAKKMVGKDKKSLILENVSKQSLIPDLANSLFLLKEGQNSEVLSSPLGYHVFLLTKINQSAPIAIAEAKKQISHKLLQDKQEKLLKDKISAIEDELLTSNSLEDVAAKFGFKVSKDLPKFDENGADLTGKAVLEIKALDDFAKNAFSLAAKQTSKLYYSKTSDQFYALMVEEINDAKTRKLEEVKSQVIAAYKENMAVQKLRQLAENIAKELKEKPQDLASLVSKYKLKFETNREFPRMYFVDYQGKKIPYADKFLSELFSLKIGEATSLQSNSASKNSSINSSGPEFIVGILRQIKKAPEASKEQINSLMSEMSNSFKQEIMQQYYQYIQKKFPVKFNQKLMDQMKEAAKNSK
jgi:peptidyl-prolyl cis-trans isomerase D